MSFEQFNQAVGAFDIEIRRHPLYLQRLQRFREDIGWRLYVALAIFFPVTIDRAGGVFISRWRAHGASSEKARKAAAAWRSRGRRLRT